MPGKRTKVAYDKSACLTKVKGGHLCSCGRRFNNKSNANKHIKIHKTPECTKSNDNNRCMKKWRHQDGDCHIATEFGYVRFNGHDDDRKWGCEVLVLIRNEDDNTFELQECGHEMRSEPQFKYHNNTVHKLRITNTTAARLKKEIEDANEKLRKKFTSLTGTTDTATEKQITNATNTTNTANRDKKNKNSNDNLD